MNTSIMQDFRPTTTSNSRASRACDRCYIQRKKCDGNKPCLRCRGQASCEYLRPVSKRVKNSHKTCIQQPTRGQVQAQARCLWSKSTLVNTAAPSVWDEINHDGDRELLPPFSNHTLSTSPQTSFLIVPNILTPGRDESPSQCLDVACNETGHWDLPTTHTLQRPVSCASIEASDEYPVLQPLYNHIRGVISIHQARCLLEQYFESRFQSSAHPNCSLLDVFLLRKQDFLTKSFPRICKPVLLASMLWTVAEAGMSHILPRQCGDLHKMRRGLESITLGLLPTTRQGDSHLGERSKDPHSGDWTHPPNIDIDDVIAYIHVATIVSTNQGKDACLFWWHAAFKSARQIGLHQECDGSQRGTVTIYPPSPDELQVKVQPLSELEGPPDSGSRAEMLSETRRRTWWLLYIHDRYLSLRFRRRHEISDSECEGRLLPLADLLWRSDSDKRFQQRLRFPSLQCTGDGIFSWLLPLLTIVGTILDYKDTSSHHILGTSPLWTTAMQAKMTTMLNTYSRSVVEFEQEPRDHGGDSFHITTIGAYARFFIQTARVLLAGGELVREALQPSVSLTSGKRLYEATNRAIMTTNNISSILEIDPDLSFIPYFSGIHLIQTGMPLLSSTDRLQTQSGSVILEACDVVVKALEVYYVTTSVSFYVRLPLILLSLSLPC
jgi:hypothetical protein